MRGMEVLRASLSGIFLIFYSLSGQAMGGTVKGSVLKPVAEKGIKKVPPAVSHPVLEKKVAPAVKAASDLSIERIYLKGCTIHVIVKNLGSGGLSDRDYEQGKLVLQLKDKEGTIKRHEFPLKDVDPKKAFLSKAGEKVDFDTKLTCSERISVKAFFEGLKQDGRQGRKHLATSFSAPPFCKTTKGKALIPKAHVAKKALHSPVKVRKMVKSRESILKSLVPPSVRIEGNELIFDKPLIIRWNPEAFPKITELTTPEGTVSAVLSVPASTVKISLTLPNQPEYEAVILASTPNDGRETIRITSDLRFPAVPVGEMQTLMTGHPYQIKVSNLSGNLSSRASSWEVAGYTEVMVLKPWLEIVRPMENERVVPENYKIVFKKHDTEHQAWYHKIWVVISYGDYLIRKLLFSFRNPVSMINVLNDEEFLWNGHLPEENEYISFFSSTLGEWWENYEGEVILEIESWFESVDGLVYPAEKLERRFIKVKSKPVFTAQEEWVTVTHSDMAVEEVVPYYGDMRIKVVNHGPETCYGQFIPFKVTLTDRYAHRTFRKRFRLPSSIPVGGRRYVYLGRDLGICLWDTSFTIGVEFDSERDWIDENASNDSYWKHFDLSFDQRPNIYFHDSGRGKIRIRRRGDQVTVRVLPKFEGRSWCKRPYTVRLRLFKQEGGLFYERDLQTEEGPVEFTLSASEVRRSGGGDNVLVEVFLDWWDDVKENNESDNWEFTTCDF
ncbi:MAG: hypothetical protein DRG40_00925 [Deltaproteobacteria bacterium]|nr:MAG: hypothetical protein DRG40_00925 [Deltaproteobacteria bacterium]